MFYTIFLNMKTTKSLFLLFFVFALSFSASAQVNTSIGLRAGLNVANFYGKDAEPYSGKVGANAGLVFNYSVVSTFGITAEVDFAMKGASQSTNSRDITTSLNYGQLAIIPTYYFASEGSDLVPKLFIGGSYGVLLSAKQKVGDAAAQDVKADFESGDLGLLLGAGLHYRLGQGRWLLFDVRFHRGLTDITKSSLSTLNNGVLALNVGVTFPLGNY
jgi:hypothetical protein